MEGLHTASVCEKLARLRYVIRFIVHSEKLSHHCYVTIVAGEFVDYSHVHSNV